MTTPHREERELRRPRRRLFTAFVLAVGIALLLSVRLSRPELHGDEITYLSSVLESMFQGTVFPIKGDGSLFVNKPPLALWLMRVACEILGPSPFAARLASVLAVAAAGAVLYLFGAAVFGEVVGVLAAVIFALTPGLLVEHGLRSATPDALEILLVTGSIVLLAAWRRRRRPWMLSCLVACAAASAWVKSPFSLAVILAYLLATELPARRAGRGTPRFGWTVAWVAGGWIGAYLLWLGLLATVNSPRAVTRRLFVEQYARRIEGRISDSHVQGPGYYLARGVDDFGPLLLLPVGAAAAAWLASRRGGRPGSQDVLCVAIWALAAPVLATASASKLHWYAYLSYPGVALLIAVSADRLARSVSDRGAMTAVLRAVVVLGVVLVLVARLPADRLWLAEAEYRGLAGHVWEIARRPPRIVVTRGPGFRFPIQHNDEYREARLFLRMLFWEQARSPAGAESCRALLVNRRQEVPPGGRVVVLHRPTRRGAGLLLVDGCGGRLYGALAGG